MSDESAFPTQMWDEELREATWLDGGLTKRELFAAIALGPTIQGLPGSILPVKDESERFKTVSQRVCEEAVAYADALLAELAKKRE